MLACVHFQCLTLTLKAILYFFKSKNQKSTKNSVRFHENLKKRNWKNWKFAKNFILHENLKDEIGKTSPRQKHLGCAFFVYKKLGSL